VYISGLDNRGGKPIGALVSVDFRDNFSFSKLFSTTIFKEVRVLVVKNEAEQKNSDFSVFAFRDSIPVFKRPTKNTEGF
jgi:hypothetical protein